MFSSPVGGHVHCFQLSAVMNKAIKEHFHTSVHWTWSGILGLNICACVTLEETMKLFPKCAIFTIFK